MPHLARDGVRLYYEEQGEGEPLLLMAPTGWPGSVWDLEQVPFFRRHFRPEEASGRAGRTLAAVKAGQRRAGTSSRNVVPVRRRGSPAIEYDRVRRQGTRNCSAAR